MSLLEHIEFLIECGILREPKSELDIYKLLIGVVKMDKEESEAESLGLRHYSSGKTTSWGAFPGVFPGLLGRGIPLS